MVDAPPNRAPWLRDRGLWLLGAALVTLALPLAFGKTLWFRDLLVYSYPQKREVWRLLTAGQWPWWSARWGTGRPLYGLLQPGVFDPLNALLAVPGALGCDLFNLAHLAVLVTGMWVYLRREGADSVTAAAAAVSLGFSGGALTMLGSNGTYLWGVSYLPWALVSLASCGPGASRAAWVRAALGVTFALSASLFAGDPQAPVFGVLLGLASLGRCEDGAVRARRALALGAAVGATAMLSASQLWAALDVARTYRAGGVTLRDAETFSFPWVRVLEWLSPTALGVPLEAGWQAPALYTRSARQTLYPLVFSAYQGLALLPLALWGARGLGRRAWGWGALALVSLVLAAGRHSPVYPALFGLVPGLRMFRAPEKYLFLLSFSLTVLASEGLSRRSSLGARHLSGVGSIALTLVVGCLVARAGGHPRLLTALGPSALAALGYTVALGLQRRSARALAAHAVALFWVIELAAANLPLLLWGSRAQADFRPSFVDAMSLQRHKSLEGVRVFRSLLLHVEGDPQELYSAVESLMPNVGIDEGVSHLDSYDAFRATRFVRLRDAVAESPGALLRWWGVDYAVFPSRQPVLAGFTPTLEERPLGLRLDRVDGAAPRFYLAQAAHGVASRDEAVALARGAGFRPGVDATVEGPSRRTAGRCVLTHWRDAERGFRCESEGPGWLIVGESFDPLWRARVNGREVPIARGNELFQAITVPGGRSEIWLWVAPRGHGAAAAVSGLTLAALVALSGWSAHKTRRRAP